MTIATKNEVTVRGFVGRYIHFPRKRGDPVRFDVGTIERFRTEDGELITSKNWHTIKTFDVGQVEDIGAGDVVEVSGRMDTVLVNKVKVVEVVADKIEILLTQAQRDLLRDGKKEPDDLEE